MRVACVLATHLRAKVELGRHRHLKDRPVLIVDGDSSAARTVFVDHSPTAVEVRAGMTAEEAVSQGYRLDVGPHRSCEGGHDRRRSKTPRMGHLLSRSGQGEAWRR